MINRRTGVTSEPSETLGVQPKSFYTCVRPRSKSRSSIGVLSRDDSVSVESPEELEEEFNEYFHLGILCEEYNEFL